MTVASRGIGCRCFGVAPFQARVFVTAQSGSTSRRSHAGLVEVSPGDSILVAAPRASAPGEQHAGISPAPAAGGKRRGRRLLDAMRDLIAQIF
jgi:hypothetical protein